MKKLLMPFQETGAKNLASNYHHMNADVPGLGKTLQAIRAVDILGVKHVLVICPASVRSNWTQELEECLGHVPAGWEIISYNGADKFSRLPHRKKYDVCVLDEAHFLKTIDSVRTRATFGNELGLARSANWIWPLTGTPVLNRPRELYPILKTLHPEFSKVSFAAYAQKFCGAYFDGRGINTKGATNLGELRALLTPFMTRRTKSEVFPGRREPLIELTPLDVTDADLKPVMEEEETIFNREAYLSPTKENFSQLGDLARLLRLTGEAKVRATCAYLDDLLETVEKVVVFYRHHDVGRRLQDHLAKMGNLPVVYDGGMNDAKKDYVKRFFMERPDCRVFLGQIQAAGTGINGLQKVCSEVVVVEQTWVPGELGQAIDRLDRMGQKSECVTARILHAPGTLESAVLSVRQNKSLVIEKLLGK